MGFVMTLVGIIVSSLSVYFTVLLPMGYLSMSNAQGEVNLSLQPGRLQRSVGEVVLDRRKHGNFLRSCSALFRRLVSRRSEYSNSLEATLHEQMERITKQASGRRFLFDRIRVDDQLTSVLHHLKGKIESAFRDLLKDDATTLNLTDAFEKLVMGLLRDDLFIGEVGRHAEIQLRFLVEAMVEVNQW